MQEQTNSGPERRSADKEPRREILDKTGGHLNELAMELNFTAQTTEPDQEGQKESQERLGSVSDAELPKVIDYYRTVIEANTDVRVLQQISRDLAVLKNRPGGISPVLLQKVQETQTQLVRKMTWSVQSTQDLVTKKIFTQAELDRIGSLKLDQFRNDMRIAQQAKWEFPKDVAALESISPEESALRIGKLEAQQISEFRHTCVDFSDRYKESLPIQQRIAADIAYVMKTYANQLNAMDLDRFKGVEQRVQERISAIVLKRKQASTQPNINTAEVALFHQRERATDNLYFEKWKREMEESRKKGWRGF